MNAVKERIREYLEENAGLFTGVSDRIWESPELSLKEFKSAALYCRVLREGGFAVEEGLDGIPTAFSGSFGSGRPVIGILGEFDALSGLSQEAGATEPRPVPGQNGVGHGCGHNMLGAGSLAAAFAVKDYLTRTENSGTVVFYGCPGEEGGAAKAFMARDGVWRGLDAALTWHPSDVNEVRTGTNNSCIQVLYHFKGAASHAAGDPENGRSALDAVELMNIGVQFLREHMTSDCRVHYAITDAGGISPNVVQPAASVLYMVRANKVADSVALQKRVDNIARGAALMTDTAYERVFIDGTAELLPNFTLEHLLFENFAETKLPVYTPEELDFAARLKATYGGEKTVPGLGSVFDPEIARTVREETKDLTAPLCDFLLPEYHGEGFRAGSTDVGDVSWLVPTAQIEVTCFPLNSPGHSWQQVSCGRTEIGHKGLLCAARVLAGTAADLFEHPEMLEKARAEFQNRAAGGYVCPIEPGEMPKAI